jgi:hypothetical protein
MTSQDRTRVVGVEPWDTEWAAERAAEALRYLGTHYPECLETLRVLDEHETAAHEPAPPKKTDSRSKKWGAKPPYQLEALPPDVLAAMVDGEITSLFDREIFKADVAAEPGTRRTIAKQLPSPNGAA